MCKTCELLSWVWHAKSGNCIQASMVTKDETKLRMPPSIMIVAIMKLIPLEETDVKIKISVNASSVVTRGKWKWYPIGGSKHIIQVELN